MAQGLGRDCEVIFLDCSQLSSQSSIFPQIIEIESFALRAAIFDECQNYLGGREQGKLLSPFHRSQASSFDTD